MIYISIIIMTEFDIYLYGIPIVLALIFLEVTYSTIYGLKLYNLKDTLAGLGLLAGNFFIGLLSKSSIFPSQRLLIRMTIKNALNIQAFIIPTFL